MIKDSTGIMALPPSATYTDPETKKLKAEWSNNSRGTPTLQLHTTDPLNMGIAQSKLLAPQIVAVYQLQLEVMGNSHSSEAGSASLCGKIDELEIPEDYENELEGLRTEVNTYLSESGTSSTQFSRDQLIALHNCTHIHRDPTVVHFLEPLALTRKHNVRKSCPEKIEMKTYPGFIGVISAKNDCGLTMEVKEFGTKFFAKGIPYRLYARQTLERCSSVYDVDWDIYAVHDRLFKPATSHQLVAADLDKTFSYSFYGDGTDKYDLVESASA